MDLKNSGSYNVKCFCNFGLFGHFRLTAFIRQFETRLFSLLIVLAISADQTIREHTYPAHDSS